MLIKQTNTQNKHNEFDKKFEDPGELFDSIFKDSKFKKNSISNEQLKTLLVNEIKSIIKIMNEILYKPPYSILFGRISISKTKEKSTQFPIDQSFYDGFGIE